MDVTEWRGDPNEATSRRVHRRNRSVRRRHGNYTADFVIDGLLPDAGGGVAHAAFYGGTSGGLS